MRHYHTAELVILEGDACEAAYFIASGAVQIFRTAADGREQVLATLKTGQSFNTVPLLTRLGLNHASVRILCESDLYVLLKEDFILLTESHADFSRVLLKDFAERLEHFTNLAENLSLYSVRARLARFLLEQAGQPESQKRWTQDEIAKQIGTVRDVVGRILRAFVQSELISMPRNTIRLLDRQKLEEESA